MIKGLVSVIIPTKNSTTLLNTCLLHLRLQQYGHIEILLVDDGKSKDFSILSRLAKKYACTLLIYNPKVKKGLFDATKKRNYAAKKAKGEYIYHFDADMEATPDIIREAVSLSEKDADAVIVKEDSFGVGIWARAKNLERRFFWGDDTIESPRFFKTRIWKALDGYDENIAGGGDDRDIYQQMLHDGYHVGRTKNFIRHNEGTLTLWYLMKKQFMYKREVLKYIRKRPEMALKSFFPIRASYFTQWRMLVSRPVDAFLLIVMKTAETLAGLYGMLYSLIH